MDPQNQRCSIYSLLPPNPSSVVPAGGPSTVVGAWTSTTAPGTGADIAPPGVIPQAYDPYASLVGYERHAASFVYPSVGVASDNSGYGIGACAQGFVADPVSHVNILGSLPNESIFQNKVHPSYSGAIWQRKKKVPKAIQPAYCEVCRIICNSQDVLNNHKLGKKHKRNVEKLKESIAPNPAKAPAKSAKNKDIQESEKDKTAGEKPKRNLEPASEADLEIKRRKVLEGGAAAAAVKSCTAGLAALPMYHVPHYMFTIQRVTFSSENLLSPPNAIGCSGFIR